MAVSFGVMDWISGGVIAALIILNISVGTWTEWEAERIVANLATVGAPEAVVRRSQGTITIKVDEVVPGDIVLLKNGDIVPADGRIVENSNLEADEAFLTGESLPVQKQVEPIEEADCPVGDRIDMVFSGSTVTKGRATVVVTGTGMATEIGKIATALQSKAERTETGWAARWHWVKVKLGLAETSPLQYKLNSLAFCLLAAAIVTAIVVLATTGFKNIPKSMATYTVAAAVSMLPVSMVAVVSLTLAQASAALSRTHVLVRRMDAIEALAGIDNVCSDMTGTLTVGRMVVRKMWAQGRTFDFETGQDPFEPKGSVTEEKVVVSPGGQLPHELKSLALCTALCNQATIEQGEAGWTANGDPTETALQVAAHKLGLGKPSLTPEYVQIVEHPFDSSVKRMSIAYAHGNDTLCLLKGAAERVLNCCTTWGGQELTSADRDTIMDEVENLASQGLRVLAFADRMADPGVDVTQQSREDFESAPWNFLGLAGIYDPPRAESADAVADCAVAKIKVRMLTGDHPSTATAIALQIGILSRNYPPGAVMTGQQFDALTTSEIDALPDLPTVVARCAPETKVRMVDALHRRHETTAMTGDGVNDSPALKRADVGVAMGTGSDVAKQASRIVLTDDNFASIVRAISKGRNVFKNLAKFLLYLLSGNVGELVVLIIGLAFRDRNNESVFPLSPVAALWINTLTAGPPAMALGLEPSSKDSMRLPPSEYRTIFTREFLADLMFYGWLMGAQALVNFVIVVYGYFPGNLGAHCNEQEAGCGDVFRARATCMATLQMVMLLHAFQCKHATRSIFRIDLRNNPTLLWCVVVLVLSTFPVIYIPVINNKVFLIAPIDWEWGIVFGQIFVYGFASEAYKWAKRKFMRCHPKRDAEEGAARAAMREMEQVNTTGTTGAVDMDKTATNSSMPTTPLEKNY
ncbi:calcium-transporting ATPase 3 [Trichosporon asahii var. asahii CBS 2479]|uniref:Calcium-transporting ATPase 3 n=1 Tax=Trichosporon asahii var. asahii (strain ATCC 90039 / CBS 2479 / JCM 2466 / KCTC 7840 / NBRC 103889/ NCYC 2677 / UAMH 7654) TaxID=1186058 RepID=J5QIL7_TRIAS|nr:calcium-transporting ATPase 3 [Trichosporon asahii var. asahii CBS 2479]EJT47518.1 calcium-transporting ATPase 3 [Trichosporon asahii var. asahii CBS 2479]